MAFEISIPYWDYHRLHEIAIMTLKAGYQGILEFTPGDGDNKPWRCKIECSSAVSGYEPGDELDLYCSSEEKAKYVFFIVRGNYLVVCYDAAEDKNNSGFFDTNIRVIAESGSIGSCMYYRVTPYSDDTTAPRKLSQYNPSKF